MAPRSSRAWPNSQPRPAGTMVSTSCWASPRPSGPSGHRPGQHPAGVGVDHADVGLEGEGQHGPGRVGADAGQRQQGVEVGGDPPAVVGRRWRSAAGAGGGPGGCSPGPSRPGAPPRAGRRRRPPGSGTRSRKRAVGGDHPVDLGLLGHDLADQHRPRVTGGPPGQVGPARAGPSAVPQLWMATPQGPDLAGRSPDRRRRPAGLASGLSSRRRRRRGAGGPGGAPVFHTITLRRKKHTSSPRWLNPLVSTVTTPRSSLDFDAHLVDHLGLGVDGVAVEGRGPVDERLDLEVGDGRPAHVGDAHAEDQRVDQVADHHVPALDRFVLGEPGVDVQGMVVHGDHAEEVVVGLGDGLARPVPVDVARLEVLEVAAEGTVVGGHGAGVVRRRRRPTRVRCASRRGPAGQSRTRVGRVVKPSTQSAWDSPSMAIRQV